MKASLFIQDKATINSNNKNTAGISYKQLVITSAFLLCKTIHEYLPVFLFTNTATYDHVQCYEYLITCNIDGHDSCWK